MFRYFAAFIAAFFMAAPAWAYVCGPRDIVVSAFAGGEQAPVTGGILESGAVFEIYASADGKKFGVVIEANRDGWSCIMVEGHTLTRLPFPKPPAKGNPA